MSVLLDRDAIVEIMPSNKKDIVLIDEINGLMPGIHVVSTKYVSKNELFKENNTTDDQEQYNELPRFSLIEIMLQSAMVSVLSMPEFKEKKLDLAEINKAKFKSPVLIGDTLTMDIKIVRIRGNVVICKGYGKVKNSKVFLGEITFCVLE